MNSTESVHKFTDILNRPTHVELCKLSGIQLLIGDMIFSTIAVSFICAQMPMVMLDPMIPQMRKFKFFNYGKWTEDSTLLEKLGVVVYQASTNQECCVVCAQIPNCLGAAWRMGTILCKIATNSLNFPELPLTDLQGWSFFIKEEYLSSAFGMYFVEEINWWKSWFIYLF